MCQCVAICFIPSLSLSLSCNLLYIPEEADGWLAAKAVGLPVKSGHARRSRRGSREASKMEKERNEGKEP